MQKLSSPIDLIKKSLRIFFEKQNLVYFLKIYGWLLPFQLFFIYQSYFIDSQTKTLNLSDASLLVSKFPWFVGLVVIVNLLFLVVSFWVMASGIRAVANVVSGEGESYKQTFASVWPKLFMFSVLSIIVGLITGLGFLLLIVPGVLFLVWFHFSSFEFMTKEIGIKLALSNSKRLVSGRFWQVFGRIVVFSVFVILVQFIFSAIPMGLGSAILSVLGALFVLPYFLLYQELS